MVLLPQPEAPTNATNSPGLIVNDTPLSTRAFGASGYANWTLSKSYDVQPFSGTESLF